MTRFDINATNHVHVQLSNVSEHSPQVKLYWGGHFNASCCDWRAAKCFIFKRFFGGNWPNRSTDSVLMWVGGITEISKWVLNLFRNPARCLKWAWIILKSPGRVMEMDTSHPVWGILHPPLNYIRHWRAKGAPGTCAPSFWSRFFHLHAVSGVIWPNNN